MGVRSRGHMGVPWPSRGGHMGITWGPMGALRRPPCCHTCQCTGWTGRGPACAGEAGHLVVTWPLHLGRRSSALSSERSPHSEVLAWSVTQRPQAQACRRALLLMGPGGPWLGPGCGTCPAFLLDSGLGWGPVSAFLKAQGLKSASRAPFADDA